MLRRGVTKLHHLVALPIHATGPFEKKPEVTVAGEISAWDIPLPVPVALDDRNDARGTLQLHLPAGVYAYKLIVNGAWTLDANALRTRSEGQRRNHVLSVAGTPEPLLFAPGPPWIVAMERGGVRVVAALRHGHGKTLMLCWDEPGETLEHRMEMKCVGDEDEHTIFEAGLPISSGKTRLRFLLEDGRLIGDENGAPLVWSAPRDTTPKWWREAVVYTVFVDRFRPRFLHPKWPIDPGPQKYAGGHLDGVTHALPALAELGVTVVYLTPIHIGANCHRYDLVDPTVIDPRVGGEIALARLLEAAHALGMRIALDFTCSHAGNGFFAYEDVKKNHSASPYAAWFLWSSKGQLLHYGSRKDAPLFNLHNADVRAYFIDLVKRAGDRGIDALRLDAAVEVPYDFARQIRQVFLEKRPDGIVFGEFVHLHSYRFIDEEAGDAATEFGYFDMIAPFLAYGTIDAANVARRLLVLERDRGAPAFRAVRFSCTHDHPRLATLARLRGRSHHVPLGFLMLFTLPGVPMLLYGEELGLWAERPEQTRENVWPDRMPMPWPAEGSFTKTDYFEVISILARLRREMLALREGELSFAHGEGSVLVYRRQAGGEIIDIALNAGDEDTEVELEDEQFAQMERVFHIGTVSVEKQRVRLGQGSGVLLRRSAVPQRRKLSLAGNAVLRDRDFQASAQKVLSRPSRLDLAITELCNLRCAHCITDAPARTASRTAREWSPWLLDLIRDDLAHAEHIAFVHGGESLVSPMVHAVLDAYRESRNGLSSMVHLLTNGVLLTARNAELLVGKGVQSISVSLDGATAETNDCIREGGRFRHIVDNIRTVIEMRVDKRWDLRLGISTVVMQQNIAELEALVDLCVDLGVDWLKLEEAVPVNEFAKRSLIRLDHGSAAEAVQNVKIRARQRGLILVDHTVERAIWRCRLEDDIPGKTFLEADGFANRTSIHPCRGPWEIACIEANGDVRMGHFFGPVMGNVAEEALSSLWNSRQAKDERARSISARLCKNGPLICLP